MTLFIRWPRSASGAQQEQNKKPLWQKIASSISSYYKTVPWPTSRKLFCSLCTHIFLHICESGPISQDTFNENHSQLPTNNYPAVNMTLYYTLVRQTRHLGSRA